MIKVLRLNATMKVPRGCVYVDKCPKVPVMRGMVSINALNFAICRLGTRVLTVKFIIINSIVDCPFDIDLHLMK